MPCHTLPFKTPSLCSKSIVAGFALGSMRTAPAYRSSPSLDWIWKLLPVKESRLPTTSSAALPSRSAVVAVQVPCTLIGAASAGCAQASASTIVADVSQRMELLRAIFAPGCCMLEPARAILPDRGRARDRCRPWLPVGKYPGERTRLRLRARVIDRSKVRCHGSTHGAVRGL